MPGHRISVLSNGALKFSRVTLGDAGTYQCLAKNDAGVAVGKTKLVLQGTVKLTLHQYYWNSSAKVIQLLITYLKKSPHYFFSYLHE